MSAGAALRQRSDAVVPTNITGGEAAEWRRERDAAELGWPRPEPTAATREAEALALWRNAKTPELRAHLRKICPDLFSDRFPTAPIEPRKIVGFQHAVTELGAALGLADEAYHRGDLATQRRYLMEAKAEFFKKLPPGYTAGFDGEAETASSVAAALAAFGLLDEASRRRDKATIHRRVQEAASELHKLVAAFNASLTGTA